MASFSLNSSIGNDTENDEEPSFSLFDISVLVPVTIICILLFFLGIAGNVTIILIFKRYKEMQTTVNMYLSSMALSDSLIFLGLPSDLYRIWKYKPYIFGNFLCKFIFYLNESCTYCSILHITTLSIERYFAICFPLKAKATITKSRVRGIILLIWFCSLVTAIPILFLFGVEHRNGSLPEETNECKCIEEAARSGLLKAMAWLSTLYFFLPVSCLVFLYGLICRKLWGTAQKLEGQHATTRERYHRHTVKMLAVVVLAFVLCWLPLHVGRILFVQGSTDLYDISQYFNLVSMLLFYFGAFVNPILYNVMSQKYRKAMCKFLNYSQAWQPRHFSRSNKTSVEGVEISSFL
ncbi:growth hormone secretagogue receptor type 1-like [Rhineura floridana]|uniref:growth hormone secretagogue receptor type 1-like n=1 Tax=Rhineura floridana TaxID=261503 RepID=UPI002AC8387E|nr:growth hormone secretagogue receptor type 1-like [Rhineura floridana]XP_061454846.1 growth hormone secretagogue receptor type 1-like [Rhineura floridana]XP_061454847.1 growth hormone secretagogue receptor type 1-like [Rhineura floridana]XP_061454849.1 growth hormone secretagogue receptor type 1-like [Rhineura floridana]XP_061454850.1 growth hormone secretagogue receptor type 1-like [Rhineura floridana]XP_061454851.1 growth hormone secretagogue receptor type 1-like [Rhineura floridana]XP_06